MLQMDELEQLARNGTDPIPSLPERPAPPAINPALKMVAAAVTGGATLLLAPQLGLPTEGSVNEEVAASVAAFTFLAAGLKAPWLCSTKGEQREIENYNILRGTTAGGVAGFGAAAAAKVATDVAVTGGLVTLFALTSGAAVWIYNRISKTKYCAKCHEKDSCSHIVCRKCLFLHIPKNDPIDCGKSRYLSWYDIVSQFRNDGLNYCESMQCARDHIGAWGIYRDAKGDPTAIDCGSFVTWREANPEVIPGYRKSISTLSDEARLAIESLERSMKS